jgi:hypothetical protein
VEEIRYIGNTSSQQRNLTGKYFSEVNMRGGGGRAHLVHLINKPSISAARTFNMAGFDAILPIEKPRRIFDAGGHMIRSEHMKSCLAAQKRSFKNFLKSAEI